MTDAGARARVALAAAQIARDWSAVESHRERASSVEPDAGGAEAALVAVSLHHAYQAFESLLERVARALELPVPAGPRAHQELLDDAALDVPGVRDAVVDEPAARAWQRVLRFRHFFRHAYLVELDAVELGKVRACLDEAVVSTRPRVERLLASLRATADEG